jgi:hypothetical protein
VRTMRELRRYLRLTSFERRIVVQSFAGLVLTRVGLRVVGFGAWKRVAAALARVRRDDDGGNTDSVSAAVVRMHAAAERRLFFKPSCLEHALVLWWLLRRQGVAAELRVGGRKEQGRFEAHAWVEAGGAPVGDAGETHRQFAPFDGPVPLMESRLR